MAHCPKWSTNASTCVRLLLIEEQCPDSPFWHLRVLNTDRSYSFISSELHSHARHFIPSALLKCHLFHEVLLGFSNEMEPVLPLSLPTLPLDVYINPPPYSAHPTLTKLLNFLGKMFYLTHYYICGR